LYIRIADNEARQKTKEYKMIDIIKIRLIVIARTIVFKIQLLIRFALNGRCYPTKEQRESGSFKDYWIGWIAYRYFSKTVVCGGWLSVDFVGPDNDFIFVCNSHGDKMSKTLFELTNVIKLNNKKDTK
jgi:hypothetical protein